MPDRDHQNVLAGLFLVIVGCVAAYYIYSNFNLGTLRRMGPGMFPGAVALIITGLGFAVMVPALFRKGSAIPRPDMRSAVAILVAIITFAFILEPFGLVPALLALVLLSSLAQTRPNFLVAVAIGIGLSAFITVVFRHGFGLRITLFSWPW